MSQRDEIHRKALRAALAVTGRAHTGLAPAIGAALMTAACSAPQPTPDTNVDTNEPTEVEVPANDSADSTEATATNSGLASAPESCASDSGVVDRDCCFAYDLKPEGCNLCNEPTPESPCLSCANIGEFGGDPTCCRRFYDERTMEEAMTAGCTPWGPPAPPAWAGLTLDELLSHREAA